MGCSELFNGSVVVVVVEFCGSVLILFDFLLDPCLD